MGDANSLDPRLEEVKQNLQRLEDELRRNQVYNINTHLMYICCIYSEHTQ